jgi:hypothetical protein
LCTLVSALKFISYCNLILLEYVCMNSESNSWPIILSRFKAIFTNFMAIALYPGVLLSKFRVCFDIYLEARPFHTLKPNINSMFSNICSFHTMAFLWGSLQPATQKARSGPLTILVKMFHWDTVTYNLSTVSGCFQTAEWCWVPVTKISWPARSRMPTMCLFREKACQPLLR